MTDSGARALELDRSLILHPWSAQSSRSAVAIAGGERSTVWDHSGRRYLDFSSQLVNVNIGYGHPAVVEAIQKQAAELATLAPSNAALVRGEAAERILSVAGRDYAKVFFTNGGADAVENAMRLARLTTGREKILSTYRSYHGNTGGAISATGDWRRIPNEYARGHVHFFGPFPYRSEFWSSSPEEESARALHHLERVIVSEGPESIAAVLLESIPGGAGVIVPPPGYLKGVRELTRKHGIRLIIDEVMSGFGRTGDWLAFHGDADADDIHPDLITFAKGVNSGYVPVGGVIMTPEIASEFDDRVFAGGLTYSGHPLAMASIVATIDAMRSEGIVENACEIGEEHLAPGLRALADSQQVIGEVRGRGVFWALDLVRDRETREPVDGAFMASVRGALLERGLFPLTVDNRIHVVPPCVITPAEVAQGLSVLDEALTEVSQKAG